MNLAAVRDALQPHFLTVMGGFPAGADEALPPGTRSLLLVGPQEPGFWPHVRATAEFNDGNADPLDRWSARVLATVAENLGGTALFPFGGPPWHPFIAWAKRSGRAWSSPVGLLVHDEAGLFVSYRGALALPQRVTLPPAPPCQCDSCTAQPCRTACPVAALTPQGYDVAACRAFVTSPEGRDCMTKGCRVRRSCPINAQYERLPEQSAFHMRAFTR